VAYLQQDCDAALVKIRVALRPADNCNLPPDSQVAPVEAITLLGPAAVAAVGERARKARAAKAAADGKNNAAAAAVDGWMGPVDEEGLMLGLDDIAWDQECFLGDAGEPGFGLGSRFEPNSRLSLGLAPSRSGLGSQVGACCGWGGVCVISTLLLAYRRRFGNMGVCGMCRQLHFVTHSLCSYETTLFLLSLHALCPVCISLTLSCWLYLHVVTLNTLILVSPVACCMHWSALVCLAGHLWCVWHVQQPGRDAGDV
jgi:hypothetical protein